MVKLLYDFVRSARPRSWLKNLALFAALVFSGDLFLRQKFLQVFWATIVFSILTSSVYIFNDILDISQDKLHPLKRFRPITKGVIPIPTAFFVFLVLATLSFYLSLQLNFFFFITCLTYFLLQIVYTLALKNQVILDVLAISGGFFLRVLAGAVVIGEHLSGWFYLCVIALALFLSVGKRRAELAFLAEQAPSSRKTLSLYSASLLDNYLSLFASSAWLSWALFTFFAPPPPIIQRFPFWARLPLTLAGVNKWLMVTIPIVIYGIMRYLKIIYEGSRAESPERVLLSDRPLLGTILIWGILVIGIIYGVRP